VARCVSLASTLHNPRSMAALFRHKTDAFPASALARNQMLERVKSARFAPSGL
jgi:hypothetical protein